MHTSTPFDRVVTTAASGADTRVGELPPDWAQGRSAFGGLVAAAGLAAARPRVDPERALRTATISFVGPVAPGAYTVTTSILRAGRSLSTVQAVVAQDDRVCALAVFAFGAARPSPLRVAAPAPPEVAAPAGLEPMPYLDGLMPAFTRHFDYRWTGGAMPFSGGQHAHVQGWTRLRDVARVDAAHLLAMLDAWPPPLWSIAQGPAPGSSISWLVNFFAAPPAEGIDGARFWLWDSHTRVAGEGYSDLDGRLWDDRGQLWATSRQLFADFAVAAGGSR